MISWSFEMECVDGLCTAFYWLTGCGAHGWDVWYSVISANSAYQGFGWLIGGLLFSVHWLCSLTNRTYIERNLYHFVNSEDVSRGGELSSIHTTSRLRSSHMPHFVAACLLISIHPIVKSSRNETKLIGIQPIYDTRGIFKDNEHTTYEALGT